MMGVQGLYDNGWMLSAVPVRTPWELTGAAMTDPAIGFKFELYDVNHDWTQNTNVSAKYPAKVEEMKDFMFAEFAKYQVLPLDASAATRLAAPRPSMAAGRDVFTYSGKPMTGLPIASTPDLLNTSFTMTAGGRFGGWGFYVLKGKPVFTWNLLGLKKVKWMSPEALAPGKHTIEFDYKYDGLGAATLAFNSMSGVGRGGTGVLKVDGNAVATQTMEKSMPIIFSVDETFDIGSDTGTPIDDQDYQNPFNFTGTIDKLTIAVRRPQLSPADIEKLKQGEMSAADAK
jgi:hypothetical protein